MARFEMNTARQKKKKINKNALIDSREKKKKADELGCLFLEDNVMTRRRRPNRKPAGKQAFLHIQNDL